MHNRYLLIKAWGFGLWSDMDDLQGKLLLAEITNRRPIVFWGEDSLYSLGKNYNSFEQYFLPVSDCTLGDVVSDKYSYYPPVWKFSNIFQANHDKHNRLYWDVPGLINCDADVLVSDVHNYLNEFIPWIKEDHPAYGLSEDEVYRYIADKYIKPKPDITKEIDDFYHMYMEPGPMLAVHIRAGIKLKEHPRWKAVIEEYPPLINNYLKDNPSARIFFLTDDEAVLEHFRRLYGSLLIYTDSIRKSDNDLDLCLKDFTDKRRKGVEIIKDTYLACKCDYFIGNWSSNVSRSISRLKDWGKDNIKLFFM